VTAIGSTIAAGGLATSTSRPGTQRATTSRKTTKRIIDVRHHTVRELLLNLATDISNWCTKKVEKVRQSRSINRGGVLDVSNRKAVKMRISQRKNAIHFELVRHGAVSRFYFKAVSDHGHLSFDLIKEQVRGVLGFDLQKE
jgi:hypothetical protein